MIRLVFLVIVLAGHSQFANIKHRKAAQDSKRSKKFTKVRREIVVAAMSGAADPELNHRLRSAIASAKKVGFPKDRIDAAIKSGSGDSKSETYTEMRYEGYGVAGSAFIISVLTDNKNRTASEIRLIFSQFGCSLGESGSVSFLFDRRVVVSFSAELDFNELFEAAIESGALDVLYGDDTYDILCNPEDITSVAENLNEKVGKYESSALTFVPKDKISLDGDKLDSYLRMVDKLEDLDDVQNVFSNVNV